MDQNREIDNVIMNIKNNTGSVVALTLMSARLSMKLMTFLYRQAKKGMVAVGAADRYKDFLRERSLINLKKIMTN